VVVDAAARSELGELEFFEFDLSMHMGMTGNDLGITNEDLGGLNVSQVDGQGLWDDQILWPDSQAPLEHYEAEDLRKALETSSPSEPSTLVSYLRTLDSETDGSIFKGFQISSLLPVASPVHVVFIPLKECITTVVYEAIHCAPSHVDRLGDFRYIVACFFQRLNIRPRLIACVNIITFSAGLYCRN
jgi:hypothetical protein